jgi:hypothetical protein
MADVKWSNNTSFPISSSVADADYIMGLKSGINTKWTANTLSQYIQNKLTGSSQVIYVSDDGINAVTSGGVLKPYATLDYAISQITDNSSSKPYVIQIGSNVDITTLILKANVFLVFNDFSLTVTGSVTLDADWSAGGIVTLQGATNVSLPATVNLNFSTFSSPFALVNIQDIKLISSATTINITSNSSTSTILLVSDVFGNSNEFNWSLTNCYGTISNGTAGNITLGHTSETVGSNFCLEGLTKIGNLSVSSSTAANFQLTQQSCVISGNATYTSFGSGTLNITSKAVYNVGSVTLNNGVSGGSVNYNPDVIYALPTLLNGATFVPSAIADGMNADYSPTNYTPVNPSVTGHLSGIDTALGDEINVPYNTPQLIYVDATNGNDSGANGSQNKPFLTYGAASAYAVSQSPTTTNQYALIMIGEFTESEYLIYPFVSVYGVDGTVLNTSGGMGQDSSWDTTSQPTVVISNLVANVVQGLFQFSVSQNATMNFNVDWGTTSSIIIEGSNAGSPENIFFTAPPLSTGLPEYDFSGVNIEMSGSSMNASAVVISNTDTITTTCLLSGVGSIGSIFNATVSSGYSFLTVINSPLVSNINIQDSQSFLAIDSTSYVMAPNFGGSATQAVNQSLISLSDGSKANLNFTPANYTPLAGINYSANSVTGNLAGIDVALGGTGGSVTLQDAYNNTSATPAAAITLDGSGTKPLQLLNGVAGSPQSYLQFLNTVNPNSFAVPPFGIDYLGLNDAPTIVSYARTESYVTSASAGFENAGWRVNIINNGTVNTVLDVYGADGSVSIPTVGGTLKIAQGTNACAGTGATMVDGIVTVNTTAVNTGDIVLLTCTNNDGTPGFPSYLIDDGVSFTINSTSLLDSSTYSWVIVKAA